MAFLCFPVLAACQKRDEAASVSYYRGLLAAAGRDGGAVSRPYFEAALRSRNPFVRQAAALALPPAVPAGTDPAVLILTARPGRLGRWEPFFESAGAEGRFSPAGEAAIRGRFAVARSAFAAALTNFSFALEQDPLLFLRHSETLTDLGRSFQFGSRDTEGSRLFQEWEAAVDAGSFGGETGIPPPESEDAKILRYRLLYFAGRIERQRGNYHQAADLFDAALELAPFLERRGGAGQGIPPAPGQGDACIWYILDMNFRSSPDGMVPVLEKYLPRLKNPAIIDDILEQLARNLSAARRWESLKELYTLLEPYTGSLSRAQYAWILGRAAETGLFQGQGDSEAWFAAARDMEVAPFYYRALASSRLDGGKLDFPADLDGDAGAESRNFSHPDEMSFLLGFFRHGAAGFAWEWIAELQAGLDIRELRVIARTLQGEGRWDESLRLVSAWMERDGYRINRVDMELYYPRPYRAAVEQYAGQVEMAPWLFFGLVRTESAFMNTARSGAGAAGLSQLMEDTAAETAARYLRGGGTLPSGGAAPDLLNPEMNLLLGALHFRSLGERLPNTLLSLLAYNAGLSRVRRWQRQAGDLPPDLFAETVEYRETRAYGRRVLSAAAAYGYFYYGLTMEEVLADILD